MDIDDFEATTGAFLSWLSQIGVVINPKMALVDMRSEGRGRGAIAVADLKEDEVVFTIPRSAVLNIKTATSTLDSRLQSAIAEMPSWLALSTIMLAQGSQEDSKWAPYFAILPRELDSLVFWSDSELTDLQASTVVGKIGKGNAEEMFSKYIFPLAISNASIEMCHRVSSIIMAYAFDIPEKSKGDEVEHAGDDDDELVSDDEEDEKTVLSMIPLADMLNADADRNNVRLCCDNEDLEMRVIKPIAKGEEIFNDYGEIPRSDLVRRYGYVTDNYAPFDVAEVMTEALLSMFRGSNLVVANYSLGPLEEKELERRVALAERENVYEDSYDICLARSDEHSIPDELVALVYILLLSDEHLKAIETSETSLPSRSKLATELVGQVLAANFRIREKDYPTSIEEDENLLQTRDISKRMAMAIQVRIGEKRVLKEAILTAESFPGSNRKMRLDPQHQISGNESGQKRKLEEASHPKKKGRHR